MQVGDDLPHGDDGVGVDAVLLLHLLDGGLVAGALFHPVHRDDEGADVHLGGALQHRQALADGGAGGDDVLNDGDPVAVLQLVAHHGAALAVVLGLLAVEAVVHVLPVLLVEGDGAGYRQGDALVGGAEQGVHLVGQVLVQAGGVKLPQFGGLIAGLVVAGVDEVGGFAAALGGEIAEGEHPGAHHELDKFLFVGHLFQHPPVAGAPDSPGAGPPGGADNLYCAQLYHSPAGRHNPPAEGSLGCPNKKRGALLLFFYFWAVTVKTALSPVRSKR